MTAIEFQQVTKQYGQGSAKVVALKDINFKAQGGQVVLIMGPSGAGKSTFLTIAGALQKPTSGQVTIGGHDVTSYSNKQQDALRLNQIGFVLQAHNLVPYLTVSEQFALVDHVKSDHLSVSELQTLLKKLGLLTLVHKYPNQLSGGQMQRVAIVRALYAKPEIILADEPTASLDEANVAKVGQLFAELAHQQNRTVILITHDQRLKSFADRCDQMMDGRLMTN